MAEYWKSTGKKYCDFCKCWTADNKASIDFHERGKNHQANVKRRLSEIKKNSMDKRKKDEINKEMFQKMEKAALAAVQKDINRDGATVGKSDLKNIVQANSSSSSETSDTYPWTAMKAPQGFTYYYNSVTGASTWEMPEVFKELERKKAKESEVNELHAQIYSKEKQVKQKKEVKPSAVVEEEQRHIHPLLGGWSTVQSYDETPDVGEEDTVKETNEAEPTTSETNEENEKPTEQRETGKKFKEKVININTLQQTTDSPVVFKKRKNNSRNVRKRDDDG